MKDLEKLKENMEEIAGEIKGMFQEQQKSVKETGKIIPEFQKSMEELTDKQNQMEAKIAELEVEQARVDTGAGSNEEKDMKFGFKDLGEFMEVAMNSTKANPNDDRLKAIEEYCEEKEISAGVGASGGFLIPPQFGQAIKPFEAKAGVIRPRAMVIPAGNPPDAKFTMPALDQSGSKGVYAGVQVVWLEEGGTKTETTYTVRDVQLEPHEVAAYITLTNKSLRNTTASGALATELLRGTTVGAEEDAFMNGNGIGKPLGIQGHGSVIEVNRNTASDVKYVDIANIFGEIHFSNNLVWVVTQKVIPKLMQMTDAGGNNIWQPNAREASPGSLMGIPIEIDVRNPTLGNTGDIGLYDFKYYTIKDGSGMFVSSSEHTEFKSNKTVIKITWNVDGQPAITTPLQEENGETVSPFVVLADPETS
jgi:HK97 family phage major capsid protein